jgi:hypothetical protein
MGAPDDAETICVFGDSHCVVPCAGGVGVFALVFVTRADPFDVPWWHWSVPHAAASSGRPGSSSPVN